MRRICFDHRRGAGLAGLLLLAGLLSAQTPQFVRPRWTAEAELQLELQAANGQRYQLQWTTNLVDWQGLATTASTGLVQHVDTAAPYLPLRFYRAVQAATNALTGDHLPTAQGEAVMRHFNHASFLLWWNNRAIYVDPTATNYVSQGYPRADLILVTHNHSDHYNRNALNALTNAGTVLIVSSNVFASLVSAGSPLTNRSVRLLNGQTTEQQGVHVEAVPATNSNHPLGAGNGYIVTLGGMRIYISGDTSETIDRSRITNIEVAFVCCDGQYNMGPAAAAQFVRAIRPKVVYPYHYNQANPAALKVQVGRDLGIEVRLRPWE
ncbi:MAG: MBL fold metallo-hydrolase [Verrucomicrobiae bacterium]|nr:MBL fold metallo-hydrolase [Verrucomicrobiae bacterium]